jgi:hypothetical protein
LIAQGDAATVAVARSKLTKDNKQSLMALKALIDSRLDAASGDEQPPAVQNGESTPQSTPQETENEDTEMSL